MICTRGEEMAKAKLTKEQAEAFERARAVHTKKEMIEIHSHETFSWVGYYEPLNDLYLDQLKNVLKNGYEVEENV